MPTLPPPPFEDLRDRLEGIAERLERSGDIVHATSIRDTLAQWAGEQDEWNRQVRRDARRCITRSTTLRWGCAGTRSSC
jgi:predicted transcriptional regulator